MDEDCEGPVDSAPQDGNDSQQYVPVSRLEESFESRSDLALQSVDHFNFDSSVQVRGGNYGRGCKWSPDGLCLLTCSQDHKLRLFEIPPATGKADKSPSPENKSTSERLAPKTTLWNLLPPFENGNLSS